MRARHDGAPYTVTVLCLGFEGVDAAAREALTRRVDQLASLDHPNIERIYEVWLPPNGGLPLLLREYLDGPTLADLMRLERPLPIARVRQLFFPLARALQESHQRRIIHRNLRPENIRIRWHDASPVAREFSLVQALGGMGIGRRERQDLLLGSILHLAPEQLRGEPPTAKADLYSFAVLMYEALTGQAPFQVSNAQRLIRDILEKEPPAITVESFGIPQNLAHLVVGCLAKKPEDREHTVEETADVLEHGLPKVGRLPPFPEGLFKAGYCDRILNRGAAPDLVEDDLPQVPPAPAPPPPQKKSSFPWLAALLAVALLVAAVVAVRIVLYQRALRIGASTQVLAEADFAKQRSASRVYNTAQIDTAIRNAGVDLRARKPVLRFDMLPLPSGEPYSVWMSLPAP